MKYVEFIESIRLIDDTLNSVLTTGDLDYPGTALEVYNDDEEELFTFIINERGERQVLFYDHSIPYRLSLDMLEKLILVAKEKVRTE